MVSDGAGIGLMIVEIRLRALDLDYLPKPK